jgi:GNAT superfamily N-acetyltransferase
LPDGYALRAATEEDRPAAWTVLEDAFLEWSDRERQSLEDFGAQVWLRPGFEPWNLRVVTDPGGEVVGVTHVPLAGEVAYVARVGVRRDQRGRGLATALLADAFREGRAHGAVRSELATDSRTGALDLYRKIGMVVTQTWVNRALEL